MISVLDPKREVGLWHSVLTVSTTCFYNPVLTMTRALLFNCPFICKLVFNFLFIYFQSVMNGMHVIYVPPSVLKNAPAMWLQMVTKHRGM